MRGVGYVGVMRTRRIFAYREQATLPHLNLWCPKPPFRVNDKWGACDSFIVREKRILVNAKQVQKTTRTFMMYQSTAQTPRQSQKLINLIFSVCDGVWERGEMMIMVPTSNERVRTYI